MDLFTNKTYEELIEYCKEKGINYLTKLKKPMAHKTILSNLKKLNKNEDEDEITMETNDLDLIINKCHNYLYKSSGVVGSKAQNDIMRILIMRIFNILIQNKNINLISIISDENIKEKVKLVKKETIEEYKKYLIDINNLLPVANIKNIWNIYIKNFISKLFPNIYIDEDSNFNTPNDYDIIKLIRIISKFKITDEFIKDFSIRNGDIHESFLKYQGKVNSKELGQFFTPREVIISLLNECGFKDLILNKEGSNLSLCDLCMGTGGLLTYTYNYCKEKIDVNKIYGCDIEKDTIKFGCASMMLATNTYNSNFIRCNSLIENPYLFNKDEDKFDIIIMNPPFGTKNNYKYLNKSFDEYKSRISLNLDNNIEFKDIYPIESNKGTILFIQLILYSLKKEGLACIILPDDGLMISPKYINIRKLILNNSQILKIINIKKGLFTNTGVKTKAIILKKGDYDNYNKEIEFLEINENREIRKLGIKKLNDNLQFNFNNKQDNDELKMNEGIIIKTLGEICNFLPKSKRNAKYGKKEGKYPFFTSSLNIDNYVDEPDYNEESLIIGDGGSANINYGCKFSTSDHCYVLQNKDKSEINLKYCYYYLLKNLEILEELFTGIGLENISKEDISNIKIKIPSIKKQKEIVEYLDFNNDLIKTLEKEIELTKKNQKNDEDIYINSILYSKI